MAELATNRVLRVAFIGCGKSKLSTPAPAQDLYTGNLFRAARRHVEGAGYDAWWILSAHYGLLSPCEVVRPYDVTIDSLDRDQLRRWQNRVDSRFRLDAGYGLWSHHGGRLTIDVFAGAPYVRALPPTWASLPWSIDAPHTGLQIGERLAAFAREAA